MAGGVAIRQREVKPTVIRPLEVRVVLKEAATGAVRTWWRGWVAWAGALREGGLR